MVLVRFVVGLVVALAREQVGLYAKVGSLWRKVSEEYDGLVRIQTEGRAIAGSCLTECAHKAGVDKLIRPVGHRREQIRCSRIVKVAAPQHR